MAKDAIVRLKVDSKEYESKIERARSGMLHLEDSLRQAGKTFKDADAGQVAFVRDLGKMPTQARTARGALSELTKGYTDLAMQYKRMTDLEKQSPLGQALLGSLTQLKARIDDTKKSLKEVEAELDGTVSKSGKLSGLKGLFSGDIMSGALQVFGGNIMTKAAGVVAQLGSEMADMVKQGIELAKQGEGIRNAFERLGRGDILDGLRQATHGTVTDLELMKAAVKFNDFRLPVEELGTMLAFAQQKAKDTGQSVDYMVDSIVTGLGRKSLMILDNLGLSAAEIKERMAETGDMTKAVGAIIREQMTKAGDYVETAADRAAQANVSMQNKMEELGRKFAPLEEASNQLWTSMKIGILDVVGGPLATLLNNLTDAGRRMNALNKFNGGENGEPTRVDRQIKRLEGSNVKDVEYAQTVSGYEQEIAWRKQYAKDIRSWQSGRDTGADIEARIREGQRKSGTGLLDAGRVENEIAAMETLLSQYQERAKKILEPVTAEINTTQAGQDVESLKVRLIELEAQRKKAIEAGDTDLSKNLGKQISQVKADIKALGGTITTENKRIRTEEEKNSESIRKLSEEYVKATDERKSAIRKEIAELQARNKEIKRLKDEAQGITFSDGSLPALNQQLKELQKQQSASANPQEWQQYQQQIDAVTRSINILKGSLPKDSKAQFTVDVNADQLAQLQSILAQNGQTVRVNVEAGTVNLPEVPTDDETVRVNVEAGTVNLPEVPTDDETVRVNVEAGTVNLPEVPTDDETVRVNVEAGTVNLPEVPTDDETIRVNVESGTVNLPEVPTDDETIHVNVEAGTVNLPEVPTDDETIRVNVEAGTVNLPEVPTDDETVRVNVEAGTVNLPEVPTDDETVRVNVEAGTVNLPEVPTDDETIRVNVESGTVNLPEVPTDDETIHVNVEAGTVNLPEVPTDDETIRVNVESGTVNLPEVPTDDETIRVNVEAGTVNLPEVPTDDETIRVNVESGTVNLPEVPTDDETIRVNVEATTEESMRQIMALIGSNPTMEVNVVPVGDLAPIDEMRQRIQESLLQTDFTSLSSLLTVSIQNGLDQFDGDFTSIQEALAAGIDIPDEVWEELQERINEALAEMGIEPIKLDVKTGNISSEAKAMAKEWSAAGSAIQAVGNAMQQIEDPAAKVLGTIAQAVATMALSYAQAANSPAVTGSGWGWIAFAATGLATMISSIAAIKQATSGFANGGIVDGRGGGFVGGTAYSGDNIGNVRLDAGELVLNRAQQSALADSLGSNDSQGSASRQPYVSGEQIFLGLNNYLMRSGRGEIVTSNG